MRESLDKISVVVKGNDDNTITISREIRPTHNVARVVHSPEIVVGYFSREDLRRLQDVKIEVVKEPKHGTREIWERYVSHVINKNKK